MTYSITLTKPTSIDAVGFRARRAGLEVRDCLLILEPDNQARLGLLAKRETVYLPTASKQGELSLVRAWTHIEVKDTETLEGPPGSSSRYRKRES